MFREYRNGADRRQRIIPPIKYLFWGGRRKHIRRKEDCLKSRNLNYEFIELFTSKGS